MTALIGFVMMLAFFYIGKVLEFSNVLAKAICVYFDQKDKNLFFYSCSLILYCCFLALLYYMATSLGEIVKPELLSELKTVISQLEKK